MDNTCFCLWSFLLISQSDFVRGKWLFSDYKKTDCIHVNGTSINQTNTPSRADCLGKCAQNSACFGVSFAAREKLCNFLPHSCFHPPVCSNKCANASCYEKSFCARGYWSGPSRKCVCSDTGGYVGVHCERLPHNCTDLYNHGYRPVGEWFVIDIYKNGSKNISVMCWVSANTVYTFVARNTGRQLDTNRKLSNYISGYTIGDGDFFIGLENMFALHQQGFTDVWIDVFLYMSGKYWGWNTFYHGVNVGNGTSGYQLSVESHETFELSNTAKRFPGNTIGDVLERSAQVPFSAYDSDNDLDPSQNCASKQGVGWWYKNCTEVNLFGTLHNGTLRVPGLNMSDPKIIAAFSNINLSFYVSV